MRVDGCVRETETRDEEGREAGLHRDAFDECCCFADLADPLGEGALPQSRGAEAEHWGEMEGQRARKKGEGARRREREERRRSLTLT